MGADFVIINSGNITISNLTLENKDKTLYWIINENATMRLINSRIENYGWIYSSFGYLGIYCSGAFIAENVLISNIAEIDFDITEVIIKNSTLFNVYFWIKNSNMSIINCSFQGEDSKYEFSSYYQNSNITINNSTFENYVFHHALFVIDLISDEDNEYNINLYNLTLKSTSFYLHGNKISMINLKLDQSIIWLYNVQSNISNCDLEDSNIYSSGNDNVNLSNIKVNNSGLGFIDGYNINLINISFQSCKQAIYAFNSSISFENITFQNNKLDLNLTGQNSEQSFSNLSNVTKIINYFLKINFTFQNNTFDWLMKNRFTFWLTLMNLDKEYIDSFGGTIVDYYNGTIQLKVPMYKIDSNGDKIFFGPYYVELVINNRTHSVIIKPNWIIEPNKIITDLYRELIIDEDIFENIKLN